MAMRTTKWPILFLVSVIMFCFGAAYGQMTVKPHVLTKVVTQTEYVPKYITEYVPKYIVERVGVIQEIEVTKEVYPTEFRQFESQEALGRWQAKHYLELQELGRQNDWTCVDYALEVQRRAWLDGYQMSIENLIDRGGRTGHAICSTWIGDKCIYLEPQDTKNWVGAVKGDVGLMYRPILVYPETGQARYREE